VHGNAMCTAMARSATARSGTPPPTHW
jgi:hypothetical protein